MTNSIDQELLPCPFCGNEPAPYYKGIGCMTSGCVLSGLHLDYNKWQARASVQPAGVAVPKAARRDAIYNTLRNYRMSTLDDGEGAGYQLIDAMTADGQTVAGGIEECDYLADALVDALATGPHPVSGEQRPTAYLHQVIQGDGEPDLALSFEPDSFPLSEALGFRSIACEALYKTPPAAQGVSALVEALDSMIFAYRSAIVAGHDRITELGGQCDGVDYMLAAFPDYAKAKAMVASHRAQQAKP